MINGTILILILLISRFLMETSLDVHHMAFTVKILNRKNPKISDTRTFTVITLKFEQDGLIKGQCAQKMQPEVQTV